MPKILLSYRRADAIETAARMFDYLDTRCGRNSVFSPDSDTHPAATFPEHIHQQVEDSDLVLVVIGPNWIGKRLNGTPSIHSEADPVRLLLREALARGKIITPVLVDGARMPSLEDLPQDVRD